MSDRLINFLTVIESIGFLFVIIFLWLNEALDIPHHILDTPVSPFRYQEPALGSVFVIAAWLLVLLVTRRFMRRIHELESYIVMCAWCRKVRIDGRWVSVEEFLNRKVRLQTSHSMCEVCREKVMQEIDSLPPPEKENT